MKNERQPMLETPLVKLQRESYLYPHYVSHSVDAVKVTGYTHLLSPFLSVPFIALYCNCDSSCQSTAVALRSEAPDSNPSCKKIRFLSVQAAPKQGPYMFPTTCEIIQKSELDKTQQSNCQSHVNIFFNKEGDKWYIHYFEITYDKDEKETSKIVKKEIENPDHIKHLENLLKENKIKTPISEDPILWKIAISSGANETKLRERLQTGHITIKPHTVIFPMQTREDYGRKKYLKDICVELTVTGILEAPVTCDQRVISHDGLISPAQILGGSAAGFHSEEITKEGQLQEYPPVYKKFREMIQENSPSFYITSTFAYLDPTTKQRVEITTDHIVLNERDLDAFHKRMEREVAPFTLQTIKTVFGEMNQAKLFDRALEHYAAAPQKVAEQPIEVKQQESALKTNDLNNEALLALQVQLIARQSIYTQKIESRTANSEQNKNVGFFANLGKKDSVKAQMKLEDTNIMLNEIAILQGDKNLVSEWNKLSDAAKNDCFTLSGVSELTKIYRKLDALRKIIIDARNPADEKVRSQPTS